MKLSESIRQDGLGLRAGRFGVENVFINLAAQLESSLPRPRVAPLAHAAAA